MLRCARTSRERSSVSFERIEINMIKALVSAVLLSLTCGCMTVGAFNQFAVHDEGVRRTVASAAYGESERQTLDVYVPASAPRNAPVIVFFYGGAWSSGDKREYSFAGHAFAAQGFVTVVPDYRLYPQVRFPDFVHDGAAALRWTQDNIQRYGGDPSRIVLVGHSAGAHIAAMAALDPQYARAAGYDLDAIRGVAGLAGPYGFHNLDMPLLRNVFGAVDDPRTVQPLHYVSRDGPSLLLLTGDRDRRVPIVSTQRMAEAAREAGESVEVKVYAGIDHPGILQALSVTRRDEAPVLRDVVTFARRVTGQAVVAATGGGETSPPGLN